jgi:hypothetical protein
LINWNGLSAIAKEYLDESWKFAIRLWRFSQCISNPAQKLVSLLMIFAAAILLLPIHLIVHANAPKTTACYASDSTALLDAYPHGRERQK